MARSMQNADILGRPIQRSACKANSRRYECPTRPGPIRIHGFLCTTTRCGPHPYGVSGLRRHPRGLLREINAGPRKRTSQKRHVRNSRNAGLRRNPAYSGVAATGSGNDAAVVARISRACCGIVNALCASCPLPKGLCAENGRPRAAATAAFRRDR